MRENGEANCNLIQRKYGVRHEHSSLTMWPPAQGLTDVSTPPWHSFIVDIPRLGLALSRDGLVVTSFFASQEGNKNRDMHEMDMGTSGSAFTRWI